jgi:hypothetical protein
MKKRILVENLNSDKIPLYWSKIFSEPMPISKLSSGVFYNVKKYNGMDYSPLLPFKSISRMSSMKNIIDSDTIKLK